MTIQSTRAILSVALVGVFAVSAPLAASAQPQAQNRPQAQHQSTPQPYMQQRPNQGPAHVQQRPSAPAPSHNAQHRPDQGQHQANRAGRYRITSTVNLRSGPGAHFRRAGQVRAGRIVQVDQVRGNWLHIRNQGWVSAQYARRA